MPVLPSYRRQSTDLRSKSIDWFLYEGNTGTYLVKLNALCFIDILIVNSPRTKIYVGYTCPANIDLFKNNKKSTRKRCEICSKLKKNEQKTLKHQSDVNNVTPFSAISIGNFEQANVSWVVKVVEKYLEPY